ncbi:MAG: hypothetical protein LBS97_00975 [Treponema sp.]|jgi:hypothetical protein|nr:hypothetical protein [Treponema sp.]
MNKKILRFVPFFLTLLFSCSDSLPAIADVKLMPVFEFDSENGRPLMYVYLLAQVSSNLDFADSLRLTQTETGYVWNIENPITLDSQIDVWLGSPPIMPYDQGKGFLPGSYRVSYIDTSGRTTERGVTFSYPSELRTATVKTVLDLLPQTSVVRIAIYDMDDQLLFWGERNQDLQTLEGILKRYPAAFSYRECRVSPDNGPVILFPLVTVATETTDVQ